MSEGKRCEEILDRNMTDHELRTYINLNFGEHCAKLGFKALERAGLIEHSAKRAREEYHSKEDKRIKIVSEAHKELKSNPDATIESIADRYAIQASTLRAWARKQKRPFRNLRRITEAQQDEAIKLVNGGMSIRKATAIVGISHPGLMIAVKKRGYIYNKETKKICKK